MTPSLRWRWFGAHVVTVTLALALVTLLAAGEQARWLRERSYQALEQSATRAQPVLVARPEALAADWPALAIVASRLLGLRVTLIAADGRVLGDSDVPPKRLPGVENHAGRPEVREALAGRVGRSARRSRTLDQDLIYVALPARDLPGIAVLRVAEPLRGLAPLRGRLFALSLLAAAITLALSLPAVLWVAARQSRRTRELESVAQRLGSDERGVRAREQPADELGRLGRAINLMAARARSRLDLLERERDERERILAHLDDGVVLLDGDGRVTRMNRSIAVLLGQPLPALPGTPFQEFARAPELDDLVARARRDDRTVEAEVRLWMPQPRLVGATAIPLGEGPRGAMLLVLHDLSEREALQRVRQDFVTNAAHELRTPLTSLRGYAETLLEGGLDDAEHREAFVRVIRDQAVRLEELLEDLLSLAELERPGARLKSAPCDLRAIAERQVAAYRARAARAGLALELEPGPAVELDADAARLDQVIANLVDNAVKYTEHGTVAVRVGVENGRAWCEVSDTGSGIPESEVPRIFERFYRVDKARSREKGGTGLGLSIVKHIVTLHGGELSVASRPGEGSTFRFTLPRSRAALRA